MPREKVLIVDDEADVLDLCRRILESEGYQVVTAHEGWEALSKAQAQSFDLLLTDIKMPGLGGLEVAQALKDSDANIVCVTMTGYSTMSMAIEALRMGVDEFVVKPFTPDELVSSIGKALERVRLRRENIRLKALIPLFELSKVFLSTVNETLILEQVLRIAQEETSAGGAMLMVVDPQSLDLASYQTTGILKSAPIAARGQGWDIPWHVLDQQRTLTFFRSGLLEPALLKELDRVRVGSLIGTPLATQDHLIGVLLVAREPGMEPFSAADSELLAILSGQAGIAISNARLFAEIERAYVELQKLDRMKSEFINIAAHELRTPLAILMGYASILEEESTGETRERLSIVVRNAMRLRSLIDDMLNMRYLEQGQSTFNPDYLYLPDLSQAVVADLMPLARDKALAITVDIHPDLPTIYSDRQKVEIILANLLSNAIKFTPSGGRVVISAERTGKEMIVHVTDTGVGIPTEALERIFEPFFQVEDSLTREHGGIGLGLSISRGMVERVGGRLWVESVLGRGSRFSFSLPLHSPS